MMKRLSTLLFLFALLLLLAIQGINQPLLTAAEPKAAPVAQANSITSQADVAEALGSAPVMFIENVGQFDEDARFHVRGGDYSLWLADDALWITLLEAADNPQTHQPIEHGFIEKTATDDVRKGVNLKLSFVDATPQPEIEPFNLLDTKMNYFLGNDEDKWRSNVPVYGGVRYKNIYPGIDLELTSQDGQMVQRFVATEDAGLDAVRLRVEGADGMELLTNRKNNDVTGLRVSTAIGDVTLPLFSIKAPDGTPLDSTRAPTLNANQILAPFTPDNQEDRALAASSSLTYSTFIGGSSDDHGYSLALDSAGNAVVTGKTSSSDFPTMPGSYDTSYYAGSDTFVLKLNSAGNALLYSTFIGGGADDAGNSLALDSAGNAYVTGVTYSSDFPIIQGYDTTHNGNQDVFVLSLNAAGNSLSYSTFIGGSTEDVGNSLALDSADNIYVTGWTESANFPTQGGYDTSYNGGQDLFVFKLNSVGLIYSTFIGGSQYDYGSELVVDSSGRVVVTGNTQSSDFPTPYGYDTIFDDASDIFVLRLNQAGNDLDYSTFIGGSDYDFGCGLALDSSGNVIVTGGTSSDNFPTQAGYDTDHNGYTDSFILKLSSGGNNLLYSTFIGGTNSEYSCEVALDSAGNPVITGVTWSSDFPTTDLSEHNGDQDAFLLQLELSEGEDALLYSTFLGGSDYDHSSGLALDSAGNLVITGWTFSSDFLDFPPAQGYDTSYNGGSDVFVSRFGLGSGPTPTPTPTNTPPTNSQLGTWSEVNSPTSNSLFSVAMLNSTDGWAVGGYGTILRWNGSVWSQVNSPTSEYLYSVTMLNSTDGWAVGRSGTILRWNGSTWSQVNSPTSNSLGSVAMVSSTDGWAVGNYGTILYWDGNAWSQVNSPTSELLSSVAMVSSTDGWAVGDYGTILHWDGSAWSQVEVTTSGSFSSVTMLNSTDGWAVGYGLIMHWDGNVWSQVPPTGWYLFSVAMLNSTDGWAVGFEILHWDGSTWSQVNNPSSSSPNSVAMVSSTDGWAVGSNGVILRYTGNTPTPTPTPTATPAPSTYSISGRVTDGSGTGISGVTVSASGGQSATTDSNGNYTIANLAPGNYTLTPSKESYTFEPASRTVSVEDANVTGQDFTATFLIDITSFRPNANGYQFPNKQLWRTWEMFEQFYGTDKVKKPDGSRCRGAETYFNEKYKNVAKGWSCVGFSMTSLLSYLNWPQPNAGPFAMGHFERLYDQPESALLTNPIAYYSGTQLSKQSYDEYIAWLATCDQDPNQMVERIKQGIQSQDPVLLALNADIDNHNPNIGYHALAPYRFVDVSATITDIYVYDSEAPSEERVIRFQRSGNGWQWEYTFTGSLSEAGRQIGGCKDMYFFVLRTSLEQGEPPVNFCQSPSDRLTSSEDTATGRMLVDLPALEGDWIIQDSAGRQLGWVNGQLVSEIPDAYFMPQALGTSISDRTLYLPAAEYTVEVHNSPTEAIDYTLFGDGRMIEVAGQFLSSGARAEIQVASGLEQVTLMHPQELNEFTLSFNSELPTLSRVATLDSIAQSGSSEINTSFDNEQLVLSREEGTLEYNLMLMQTGGETGTFISEPLSLAANDTHTLKPTNWTSLTSESVILEIDQGSDGTVDQTVQLDNQVKLIYLPLLTR